jgi:hypothetical protein
MKGIAMRLPDAERGGKLHAPQPHSTTMQSTPSNGSPPDAIAGLDVRRIRIQIWACKRPNSPSAHVRLHVGPGDLSRSVGTSINIAAFYTAHVWQPARYMHSVLVRLRCRSAQCFRKLLSTQALITLNTQEPAFHRGALVSGRATVH